MIEGAYLMFRAEALSSSQFRSSRKINHSDKYTTVGTEHYFWFHIGG